MFKVPEQYRITAGKYASKPEDGNNGIFSLQYTGLPPVRRVVKLLIVASDGEGWEHVSVHAVEAGKQRCPTWIEMANVKNTFWGKEDCVVQFHPPENNYVNFHPFTLHLWRKPGFEFPQPPPILVGPRSELDKEKILSLFHRK